MMVRQTDLLRYAAIMHRRIIESAISEKKIVDRSIPEHSEQNMRLESMLLFAMRMIIM